jgi:hypothetical protein
VKTYIRQIAVEVSLGMLVLPRPTPSAQAQKPPWWQLRGVELVDSVARLCCVNLVLHGIGSDATHVPAIVKDALAGKHREYEMVLTNRFEKRAASPL